MDGSDLDEADLQLVRAFIRRETGIELSSGDQLVRQRMQALARRLGLLSARHVVDQLRSGTDPKLATAVVEAMTTNVTSFFRDPELFTCLADSILPELVRSAEREHRPLMIWSAACASGQEAVSAAIVIQERFGHLLHRPGRVRIVATDISAPMVERTSAGVYNAWEMGQGLSDVRIDRFFQRQGDTWVTRPTIRSMIEAHRLNLLAPWPRIPRCDLILLRNVLIYFSAENRNLVLERIRHEVVRPEGSLVLGGSEGGLFTMSGAGFRSDRLDGATHYVPI